MRVKHFTKEKTVFNDHTTVLFHQPRIRAKSTAASSGGNSLLSPNPDPDPEDANNCESGGGGSHRKSSKSSSSVSLIRRWSESANNKNGGGGEGGQAGGVDQAAVTAQQQQQMLSNVISIGSAVKVLVDYRCVCVVMFSFLNLACRKVF